MIINGVLHTATEYLPSTHIHLFEVSRFKLWKSEVFEVHEIYGKTYTFDTN
jgi:hypothetical protein